MAEASGALRVDRATKTLRELALEKMRDAILSFHFKPGDRLVERSLCEALGVSRTVVREVLRHLESEGLVATLPHHGPIVAQPDAGTAAEIYELRAVLEGMAARACAERATPTDMARLAASMAAVEQGYAEHNPRAILDATTGFYETMFLAGGKLVAWAIVQSLNARINHLRAMTIASPDRQSTGPAEMHRILAAIRQRDAATAEAAGLAHVRRAAEIAMTLLEAGAP